MTPDGKQPSSGLHSQSNIKQGSLEEERLARRKHFNLRGNISQSQMSRMKESQMSKSQELDAKNTQGRWSREEHEKFIEG